MSAAGDVLAQVSDPRLVEERRGQIVRAAVKLFSEEGYYPTTIQKIARAAGVFAVTGEDAKNLVVTLSAKSLNPSTRVVARCHEIGYIQGAIDSGRAAALAL